MKICPKCNTQMPDDALFCNSCGQKLPEAEGTVNFSKEETVNNNAEEAANNNPTETNQTLKNAKKEIKNKQIGLIAIILAGAVLLIVVLTFLLGSLGNSYRKPIKNLENALNKKSTKIEDFAGSFLPSYGASAFDDYMKLVKKSSSDEYEDFVEDLNDKLSEKYEDWSDDYGKNYKIKVEIKDAKKLTKKDSEWDEIENSWDNFYDVLDNKEIDDEDFYEDFADDYDLDFSNKDCEKLAKIGETLLDKVDHTKIQEAYKIKAKFIIKGSEDDDSEKYDFYVIKVDGRWFIDITSNYNSDIKPIIGEYFEYIYEFIRY